MTANYPALATGTLQTGATVYQPEQSLPDQVTLEDSATSVMTDLRKVSAVTLIETANLDQANSRMIARGVRLLFVMNCQFDIVGLITTTDLMGEKPMQHIQRHGGTRSDILVKDIMTPQDKLEVIDMADVERAKVGHIVATLQTSGRQHALVVEMSEGRQVVRGLFSTTQISRQLGTEINSPQVANSFADIKTTLAG